MAYVFEDTISEYRGMMRHVFRSFNKHWLLGFVALAVVKVFWLFGRAGKHGQKWVPRWCARSIRWGKFNPCCEYMITASECFTATYGTNHKKRAMDTFFKVARRDFPPGTAYEIRRLEEWEEGEGFGEFRYISHYYPAYPKDVYTSEERAKILPCVGGEVIWSGTT